MRTFTYYPRAGRATRAIADNLTNLDNSVACNGVGALQATAPGILPPGGPYLNSVVVAITTTQAGGFTYYTLDGSEPTNDVLNSTSLPYTSPITITNTASVVTVKAKTFVLTYTPSTTTSADFTIYRITAGPIVVVIEPVVLIPPPPAWVPPDPPINPIPSIVENVTFLPVVPEFYDHVQISLATNPTDAQIYYTTNGNTPNVYSPGYSGPFVVGATTRVRAMAGRANWASSGVTEKTYTKLVSDNDLIWAVWVSLPPQYAYIATPADFIGFAAQGSEPVPPPSRLSLGFAGGWGSGSSTVVARHMLFPLNYPLVTGYFDLGGATQLLMYGIAEGFTYVDANGFYYKTMEVEGNWYRHYAIKLMDISASGITVDVTF